MQKTEHFGNTVITNDDGTVTLISKFGDKQTVNLDGSVSGETRHGYRTLMKEKSATVSGDELSKVQLNLAELESYKISTSGESCHHEVTFKGGGRLFVKIGANGKAQEIRGENGVTMNISDDGAITLSAGELDS